MSLRDRASELVDEVRSVTASERTKRLIERFRRVRDGEPWFDKRGLDTIRRRPVDDDSIERRRRWQRYLGVAFVGLLAAALWYPLVAGVGVVGCAAAAVGVGA
ncbi:4Fe-4S ferredoxin, partial [Halorubrum sp. E3]